MLPPELSNGESLHRTMLEALRRILEENKGSYMALMVSKIQSLESNLVARLHLIEKNLEHFSELDGARTNKPTLRCQSCCEYSRPVESRARKSIPRELDLPNQPRLSDCESNTALVDPRVSNRSKEVSVTKLEMHD